MHVGSISFRMLGLIALGTICSLVACSGGGSSTVVRATPDQGQVTPYAITSVAVSPSTLTTNVGTQTQFTATISGTGNYNATIIWSAQRGSITNSGFYTPPTDGGSDEVTATSVQAPTKTASVTVTVVAGLTSPRTPAISCPIEIELHSGPYTASVILGSGEDAKWSITGGTLVTAAGGASVQFQASSSPFLTLSCTVTNAVGSASSSRQMVALPFTPRNYLSDFKSNLAKYRSHISSQAATGDASAYYYTSYYLHGLAAAVDATGDTALLDELMGYIRQMMGMAVVRQSSNRDGITYQVWGPFDSFGDPYPLYTFQACSALARTAAIIYASPPLKSKYQTQADQIVAFIDQSIFKYWYDKNHGIYKNPTSKWLTGDIPWLPKEFGGPGTLSFWGDSASHLGTIAVWMWQITGSAQYREVVSRVAGGFRTHVTVQNGSWIWDVGTIPNSADPNNLEGTPDTSHANREPMMVTAMYEAGVEFQLADVQAMASTLTNIIWNQSEANPMFSNYINGSNKSYGSLVAWQDGIIYLGWNVLGKHSPQAQRVLALTWQAMMTQSPLNLSLAQNQSFYGLVEMSGTLIRNTNR